jgi:hypothetical protein
MGVLIFIGIIVFLIYIFTKKDSPSSSYSSSSRSTNGSNTSTRTTTTKQPPQPKPGTHRPSAGGGSSKIVFTNTQTGTTVSKQDLEGLNDAYTGAQLNPALGLFQCGKCKVFYHKESYDLLVEVNNSKCVACSSASIRALTETEARKAEHQNFRPDIITLAEVKSSIGSVVTFRGIVHDVKVSRRGTDYAVMFENTSWTRGFKLVFFRDTTKRIGIDYIKRLKGRTITVRGLVIHDRTFGLEMIISQKSMILED